MKTILVPTEHNAEHGNSMLSALDTALLLAQKFGSCIEGFAFRPAVADMVAMDPDAGLTMVAVKENDTEMARQAEDLFRSFMDRHGVQRRDGPGDGSDLVVVLASQRAERSRFRRQLWAGVSTPSCWRDRGKNGGAHPWSRWNPHCSKAVVRY